MNPITVTDWKVGIVIVIVKLVHTVKMTPRNSVSKARPHSMGITKKGVIEGKKT